MKIAQADVTTAGSLTVAGAPFAKGKLTSRCPRASGRRRILSPSTTKRPELLNAAREAGARHFVMLAFSRAPSGDPYALQFQYAKKDMEESCASSRTCPTRSCGRPPSSSRCQVRSRSPPVAARSSIRPWRRQVRHVQPDRRARPGRGLLATIEDPSKKNGEPGGLTTARRWRAEPLRTCSARRSCCSAFRSARLM